MPWWLGVRHSRWAKDVCADGEGYRVRHRQQQPARESSPGAFSWVSLIRAVDAEATGTTEFKNMKSSLFWVKRFGSAALVLATFSALLSCSSDSERQLHLLDGQPPALDSEAERLRKLQLVRVLDHTFEPPKLEDVTAQELAFAAQDACPGYGGLPGCSAGIYVAQRSLCEAKTLLAAASPQATVPRIGSYSIGPQSSETNAAIATQALDAARDAVTGTSLIIDGLAGVNQTFCEVDSGGGLYQSVPIAVVASTLLMESVQTYKEASGVAVNETESSSDAQLGSTSSANLAVARAVAGSALSRSAAAHLLVTGDLGLRGSTSSAFCSAGTLSPDGQAALSVLRESALSPVAVVDSTNVSTMQLVDDLGVAVPGGSVAQRLAELYQYPLLAAGDPVESYAGLTLTAFEEARHFMQEEIAAFARSQTATLPPRVLPGGQVTTYARFAATATTPARLPAAYYGAIARYYTGSGDGLFPPGPFSSYRPLSDPYDLVLDYAYLHAGMLLNIGSTLPSDIRNQALAPVALLQASGERVGRVMMKPRAGSNTVDMTVEGFLPADGIRVAIGEDQLRCAVTGTIEGASCSGNIGQPVTSTATASDASFQSAVSMGDNGFPMPGPANVYILRPHVPGTQPTSGGYDALIGLYFNPASQVSRFFPIIPTLEKRLADLLEPNPKSCSHPKVSCAGVDFDERLPLEDELAATDDGIESSWKHYLDLAKDAAAQADALGTDYINTGLQQTENTLSDQLRQEQQLERADDEIKNLQTICGTAVDPRKLLALLAPNGQTTAATGGSCATDADCMPASAGMKCFSNQCIVNFEFILSGHTNTPTAHQATDPDLQRLADCVSDHGLTDMISLGDKPVCVWRNPTDHNLICQGAAPGECPQIAFNASRASDGKYHNPCSTIRKPTVADPMHLDPMFQPPPSFPPATRAVASSEPLGYFPTQSIPKGNVGACDAFRQLRADPTRLAELSGSFYPDNIFNPTNINNAIGRLGFEFRYGGFSAITVDGVPVYTTGSPFAGGPSTADAWPCQVTANCAGATGMFCEPTACDSSTDRAATNYKMMRAFLAASLIRSGGLFFGPTVSKIPGGNGALARLPERLHYCPFDANGITGNQIPNDKGDHSIDNLVFWSQNSPIGRENYGGSFSIYDASSATGDGAVGWFNPPDTVYPTSVGTTDCIMEFSQDGHTVKDEDTVFDLDSAGFLGGMSAAAGEYNVNGWLRRMLSGEEHGDFNVPYGLYVDSPKGFSNLVEPTPFARSLTDEDFLNAAELACEVEKPPADITISQPPVVNSVDDLHNMATYMQLLAQSIRNEAGLRVFYNVPTIAVGALQNASTTGAYPQYSGTLGAQLSILQGALVRLKTNIPLLSNSIAQFADGLDTLHDLLQKAVIKKKISDLQLSSTVMQQMASCIGSFGAETIISANSLVTCANSLAQIDIASQISKLTGQDSDLDADLAKVNFKSTFSSTATNMQTLALNFQEASSDVDSSLAQIEGLRDQAKISLSRALYLASYEAQSAGEVDNVIGNLFDGKQLRYTRALKNAKLMAFLAKRGIEERLGVKLADLTDNLPLVDAPHDWESTVCDMTGIDFNNLTSPNSSATLTSASPTPAATNYANGFIGDYVTKLSNVVESYRLVNSFHQGTDTAVISLRDDLMNVRASCEQPSPNMLYYSSDLTFSGSPGWRQAGCQMSADGDGGTIPGPNCVTVTGNETPIQGSGLASSETSGSQGFTLRFGSGALDTASLSQTVALGAGAYRFSWYYITNLAQGPQVNGMAPGVAAGLLAAPDSPSSLSVTASGVDQAVGGQDWNRRYLVFKLSSPQNIKLGFQRPSAGALGISVAAPMLETLPAATDDYSLKPFVGTRDVLTHSVAECDDTDGSVFRTTKWHRDCQLLCPDGYSGNCSEGTAQSYCYQEASFSFNQRDLQAGKIANFSGFARGNFNYRIQSVGVNFVGTGTRDCSNSGSPAACSAAGYFPYSLEHVGPFYVRNYAGQDYQAHLFDGSIEHARGLASERYLTNPLSSSDESLIDQYLRTEFEGRPLDGNFVLRIWEEPGVNFGALQDVQLVFKYGYWTRLN
jgi:hypothetical protein